MKLRQSLDKVIAVAGGCLVFATGGGTVSAGAGLAGSGVGLLNAWLDEKAKRGPESKRVLARVRRKVRAEFGDQLSDEDSALLDGADYALGEIMLECIPPPAGLAEALGHDEGFAKTAALMVIGEVAARDDLFSETRERAEPLARRFALVAIEAAFDQALTDRDYFADLLPFVLEGIKRDTGATHAAMAQVGDDVAHIRATADRMAADVQRLVATYEATPAGRQAREIIGDSRPFVVLARRINQEVDDPDQALAELTEMVELMLRQQAEAERGTNLGNIVDLALREIAEKSRRGEFDAAATDAALAFSAWEERVSDRRRAEQQAGMRLIEANIEQNMLRRDANAVAGWVEQQVAVETGVEQADVAILMRAIGEWHRRGEQKGLKLDLEVAVAIARRAHSVCRNSNELGAALVCLGNALETLGDRDGGTARLEEAIVTFRAALEEMARERVPLDWAMTQNNLGNALARLGARERGTAHLEEAVVAYRAALEEKARERVPLAWATTQNNLGNALRILGERENGTARLEEAVVVFRAALEEWTHERVPLDWAMTQNNLGSALATLGERESGTARLEEAVLAFRAALEERTRERVPLDWAMTQNNLATALATLGERESGTARLGEAVLAFRAALEEQAPDRVPLDWAMTQNNLGTVLAKLGERERSTARLEEAVGAYRAALQEWTRERVPLDWAMAQNNLGTALAMLGGREIGTTRLEEAVMAFRAALEERTRERVPLDWATTTLNLSLAVARIADRLGQAADQKVIASAQKARAMASEAGHEPLTDWADYVLRKLERIEQNGSGMG